MECSGPPCWALSTDTAAGPSALASAAPARGHQPFPSSFAALCTDQDGPSLRRPARHGPESEVTAAEGEGADRERGLCPGPRRPHV